MKFANERENDRWGHLFVSPSTTALPGHTDLGGQGKL
jgi:hypothetical protein